MFSVRLLVAFLIRLLIAFLIELLKDKKNETESNFSNYSVVDKMNKKRDAAAAAAAAASSVTLVYRRDLL